jgi:N-acetylmuramoyl-L-alanine amidase CwlA
MSKFLAPSPRMIPARWHGGSQTPRLIVMHSTVGPTKAGSAEGVADFFKTEQTPTSAHYVVDAGPYTSAVIQCVPDHTVAYHCGHNQDSIGIEMCDQPAQPITRWKDADHQALMANAARLVATLCLAYSIRPWYVPWPALRLGVKGVTTHWQMTQAFHQSTHTDPGAWPRKAFMRAVRAEIKKIRAAQ